MRACQEGAAGRRSAAACGPMAAEHWAAIPATLEEESTAAIADSRRENLREPSSRVPGTAGHHVTRMAAADPVPPARWRCPVAWTVRHLTMTRAEEVGGPDHVAVPPVTMKKRGAADRRRRGGPVLVDELLIQDQATTVSVGVLPATPRVVRGQDGPGHEADRRERDRRRAGGVGVMAAETGGDESSHRRLQRRRRLLWRKCCLGRCL
jgi:hypothetical protein